nr:pentatricopeptide repeat-containing protein [Tanacetum cinerariifolium]
MFIEFVIQNQLFSYSLEEFAQILDIPCEGAWIFTNKWSLEELVYGVPMDDPYQTNPPSPDDIISYIHREGQVRRISYEEEIDVHEHQILTREIMPTLKPLEEFIWENIFCLRSNQDHVPAYLFYMLYCVANSKNFNLAYYMTRKDHGMRRGRHSTSSSFTFDQPSSSHVNDDDDDNDITIIPSPTTTSSSLTPPNGPSKTLSTNQTSSSQENTSSSFQSKLQILPSSSNEPTSPQPLNPLHDNILNVPPRPSNPQPLQSHPSLDITLSLTPITPLDQILDTPSPPSPPPTTSHGDEIKLMFAHPEYLLTTTMYSLSSPHP